MSKHPLYMYNVIFSYIHIYTYIHMCICIYVYMCICVYVCMYVCMYACMHVCMCVYIYKYIYICLYVCLYVCMNVCMCLSNMFWADHCCMNVNTFTTPSPSSLVLTERSAASFLTPGKMSQAGCALTPVPGRLKPYGMAVYGLPRRPIQEFCLPFSNCKL